MDSFLEWITSEFIDVNSISGSDNKKSFDVKDSAFKQYSIVNKKYCGSAAAKLIANMRAYETTPISESTGKVIGLTLYLMITPQYVILGVTDSDVFNALGGIFEEAN